MPERVIPGTADVQRIVATTDPVVRNLRITQCYHELSSAIGARSMPGPNWCTFATWASRQAGRTIRGEDFQRMIERALADVMTTTQATAVVAALAALGSTADLAAIRKTLGDALGVGAAFERAAAAVARGNLKVFEEIGAVFARFIAERFNDTSFHAPALDAFNATLRPGEPPDGQDHLRQAFRHYYGGVFESDDDVAAERMLLANLHIGFHEQIRLQPEIAQALDAAIADPDAVVARLLDAHLPLRSWIVRARRAFTRIFGRRSPLDHAVDALVDRVRMFVRAQLTEHMMTLELPNDVVLRLGRDLDAAFPPPLGLLSHPELAVLFARLTRSSDGALHSGATDWADFDERIHFIAVLFRAYGASASLFAPPFTASQIDAIDEGRRPDGRL